MSIAVASSTMAGRGGRCGPCGASRRFTAEGVGTQVLPGVETRLRKAYAAGERKSKS